MKKQGCKCNHAIKSFLVVILFAIPSFVFSQNQNLKVVGQVKIEGDNYGAPGVTIVVKGTSNGTHTDMDGKYELVLNDKSEQVLVYTMIGMTSVEKRVKAGDVVDVIMHEDQLMLDEVVVTGYTTEKKADITGAVSVVKIKDILSIPTGNVMSSLQGRLPGVTISTDGTPGGMGTGTAIRGTTTINNSSPLYVIDGVQTRANIATLLNANDVESIQVLKDAASASIYGTQAANGVIIITTKKAGKNQTRIDFDAQLSVQTFHTGIKMLNAQQWGDTYWKSHLNDGLKPSHDVYGNGATAVIPEFIDLKKTIRSGDTNWANEVYGTALLQNYNLTVSKGVENGSSSFSFNYYDQDGLVKETNFRRFNARMNSQYSYLDNKLRIGENATVSNWSQKLKPGGIEELAIAQHPIIPVYDMNGGYAGPTQGLGDKPNPVRLIKQQANNKNNQWRIFGNMFVEVEPIKNLVARTNFGLNYRSGRESFFEPKWSEGDRVVDKNMLEAKSDEEQEWIWSNTIAYNFDVKKHSISLLGGTETKEYTSDWLSGSREGFLIEDQNYIYLNAGEGKQSNGGLGSTTRMFSVFGKVNYSYDNKYLFSTTVRRDASSRFGKNSNAGVFPAFTAGWRISQESFMKKLTFVNDLKLRGSWGQNGNDQIDNEATYTKYGINTVTGGYDFAGNNNGVISSGIIKLRTGNPNIKWEKTTQTNIGLDASLLNNRLGLTFDYYVKNTNDMLIDRPYIGVVGEGGYMAYNGASMRNNGFEAVVSWRDRIGKDFNYEVTFSATAYKNKITDLPEDIYYTWGGGNGIDKSVVGQPYGSWMGHKTNGLYKTEDDLNDGIQQDGKGLGRIRYADINGDKVIDEKDKTWLGSDQPKFIGGLNLGMSYKNFDMSMFMTGMVRDAYNNSKFYTDFFQLWTGNHGTKLLDAWDPVTNPGSNIPALTAVNRNDEGRMSDYFIEDGSYLKLKSLVIGYTLPLNITTKLKMRSLRVYVQGQDLFTITGYSGADPEGLGYPYPLPRSFSFGLNIGF